MPYFGDESNFWGIEGVGFGDLYLQDESSALVRRVRRSDDLAAQLGEGVTD